MKMFDTPYVRFLALFALISLVFFLLFIIVLQKNKSQKTLLAEIAPTSDSYSLEYRPALDRK